LKRPDNGAGFRNSYAQLHDYRTFAYTSAAAQLSLFVKHWMSQQDGSAELIQVVSLNYTQQLQTQCELGQNLSD